jgi:histidyl-tRNA synthetase
VCAELWAAGIKCETLYKENPSAQDQNEYALKTGIPLLICLGQNEIDQGVVKVKQLNTREEEDVSRVNMVARILELIKLNPVLLTKEE